VSRSVGRVEEAARSLGLDIAVRRFPEGTRTAADAARAIGCEVAQIVKSLVFVADGTALVALTSGANRADVAKLRVLTGAEEVRRADPDEARSATGFAIGGTPPFGHPRPLRMLMDLDLLDFEEVWAAAGTPHAVFPIHPRRLLEVTGAEVADLAEH
jgi:prolyl-tRNA editing enzyme YbaK/EbsC (Cys-tRNA(Pro) deacylase)